MERKGPKTSIVYSWQPVGIPESKIREKEHYNRSYYTEYWRYRDRSRISLSYSYDFKKLQKDLPYATEEDLKNIFTAKHWNAYFKEIYDRVHFKNMYNSMEDAYKCLLWPGPFKLYKKIITTEEESW